MNKPQQISLSLAASLAGFAESTRKYAQNTSDLAESMAQQVAELGISFHTPELIEAIRADQAAHRDVLVALAKLEKASRA